VEWQRAELRVVKLDETDGPGLERDLDGKELDFPSDVATQFEAV
jgi:hypothetical protein